jgi:ribonucleotide reductase beta subunit family protein with ferritin-like domain
MGLFDKRIEYKPFEYPDYFTEGWLKQSQAHWLFTEISMQKDISEWHTALSPQEKYTVEQILLAFAQTEVAIEDYWGTYIAKWFPKYEIIDMARAFSYFESIHALAYSYLNESLGLEDFKAFLREPTMSKRFNLLVQTKADYTPEELKESHQARCDIARSIAIFSAFAEGVSLYSSFVVLYSFSLRGLLQGIKQQMKYSVKDECYSPDTEVLTTKGWVRFDELTEDMEVAQFNLESEEVSFVKPSRLVVNNFDGELVHFIGEEDESNIDCLVTPNHDMVYKERTSLKYSKIKAKDLGLYMRSDIPAAGYKLTGVSELTSLDKFKLAYLNNLTNTNILDNIYTECDFIFDKEEESKIDYLKNIIEELGWTYSEASDNDSLYFSVQFLREHLTTDYSWINLSLINEEWVNGLLSELKFWDDWGRLAPYYEYSPKNSKEELDQLQAIFSLGGYSSSKVFSSRNNCSRFDFKKLKVFYTNTIELGYVDKELIPYTGKVYCATVPDGALLTRRNGSTTVAGNCLHSTMGCTLFNHLCSEYPEVREEVKGEILEAAELIIKLEHDFIDKIFEQVEIDNLRSEDLKEFIVERTNRKIVELGYPNKTYFPYSVEKAKNIHWFYVLSGGATHTDFFALRPTDYSKAGQNEDWDDIF